MHPRPTARLRMRERCSNSADFAGFVAVCFWSRNVPNKYNVSLGSRPPPFRALFNCALAANIRTQGKAWDKVSRGVDQG